MKTLKNYIEENIETIYFIDTFVNTKNIPSLTDENTRTINFTKEGYSCGNISEYSEINNILLNSVPVKVFLMDNDKYNKFITNDTMNINIPKNKKILVALFDNTIIKENEIE